MGPTKADKLTINCHFQVGYASRALAALLNDARAGPEAAEQLLSEAVDALHEAGPGASGPALYQLLIAALDLPITCKVSAQLTLEFYIRSPVHLLKYPWLHTFDNRSLDRSRLDSS